MRHGITPVVAVVLLLMMTVASAGAAYTWFTQIQEDAQEEADRTLATSLVLKDATCHNRTVTLAVTNTGDRRIANTTASLYVSRNDDLVATGDRPVAGTGITAPGTFGRFNVSVDARLWPGTRYELEMSVQSEQVSVTGECDGAPLTFVDEGFEDGNADGWTSVGIVTSPVHTGSYAKEFNNGSGGLIPDRYRNTTVPPGRHAVTVSAWIYDPANTEDSGRIGVMTYNTTGHLTSPTYCTQTADGSGCQDESDPNFSPWTFEECSGNTWCRMEATYGTSPNTTNITIAWDGMDDAGGGANYLNAYIDDVTLTVTG